MDPAEEAIPAHLTPEQVAAHVDDGLGADERARIELHLSRCDVCRAEVVEVMRLIAEVEDPRRKAD